MLRKQVHPKLQVRLLHQSTVHQLQQLRLQALLLQTPRQTRQLLKLRLQPLLLKRPRQVRRRRLQLHQRLHLDLQIPLLRLRKLQQRLTRLHALERRLLMRWLLRQKLSRLNLEQRQRRYRMRPMPPLQKLLLNKKWLLHWPRKLKLLQIKQAPLLPKRLRQLLQQRQLLKLWSHY